MEGESYTNNWFLQHEDNWKLHILPWLKERYQAVGKLEVLEIGSYEGQCASWLLKNIGSIVSKLVCIDPWYEMDDVYKRFLKNIRSTGFFDTVKVYRYKSSEILPKLPDSFFDFIYVDGCHWENEVYKDTIQALRLIAKGGLVLWDDYCEFTTPEEEMVQVQRSVNRALSENGITTAKKIGNQLGYINER